jgi:hypothetical protein
MFRVAQARLAPHPIEKRHISNTRAVPDTRALPNFNQTDPENPGHVVQQSPTSRSRELFIRARLKLSLALEYRVPPRSSTAHGAESHPARSGPSGWCRLPEAGNTETDVVVLVRRIVVVPVRGLQVVVGIVERPAPQTAIIHVPMPQINISK